MVRFVQLRVAGLLLLSFGCIAGPALAQGPQPVTVGRTPAAGQSSVEQPVAQFPLDSFTEFSAVMSGSRVKPDGSGDEGHIYRSGKLMRMQDPANLGYFITDLSTGETFGISETGCMHDSHPFIRSFPFAAAAKPNTTVTRTSIGKEMVKGHSCQVENVTVSAPALGNPLKMRFWEAEDLRGFPVKIEFMLPGGHDPVIRYKSVVLGPQDPTLFIHPKSCEQLVKPESAVPSPPTN
jgi:hypothetical protein